MKSFSTLAIGALLGSALAHPTNPRPAEARNAEPLGLTDPSAGELDRRLEFNVNMLYAAGVATGQFAYNAAGTCPSTAKEEDVNNAQCGISKTVAAISGLFALYQAGGLIWNRGPTTGSRVFKRDSLPYKDETILGGYRTTIEYHGTTQELDGVDWHQYGILNYDIARDFTHNVTARFHPDEDRQYVSTPVFPEDGTLSKRQTFPIVTYAWQQMDQSYFANSNRDQSAVDRVGLSLWNHAHDQNLGAFCANLATDDGTQWNKGYFAIQAGQFQDKSGQC